MIPNQDGNVEIGQHDFGFSKEQYSIKEIILRHLRKISDIACEELQKSYWQKKPIKVGDSVAIMEVYHPDTRLSYIGAIDFLLDMIRCKIPEDSAGNFENFLQTYDEDENRLFEECKGEFSDKTELKNEWIEIKLERRRKLFGEIMLMLDRIDYFEGGSEEGFTDK